MERRPGPLTAELGLDGYPNGYPMDMRLDIGWIWIWLYIQSSPYPIGYPLDI